MRKNPILGMATIDVKVEINAAPDAVWEVISDVDSEPKFWKGTKEVRNISQEGNLIYREIVIAFRDQKCLQEVRLYPKERIEAKFVKGIIDGTKTMLLVPKGDMTVIHTVWDIKLTGMMAMFTGMVKSHIKGGTEQAMLSIKAEVER